MRSTTGCVGKAKHSHLVRAQQGLNLVVAVDRQHGHGRGHGLQDGPRPAQGGVRVRRA